LSCWLLSKNKTVKFTLIPAFFMLITTVFALVLQAIRYIINKDIALLMIAICLILLAGFMVWEVVQTIFKGVRRYA